MSLFRVCARVVCAVSALLALASCGGNASRVEPFRPTKFVVFGDEYSLVLDEANLPSGVPATSTTTAAAGVGNGRKYTIGSVDVTVTPNAYNCLANPVWSQYLAASFGFVFNECKPAGNTDIITNAFMLARPNATVAAVVDQYSTYTAQHSFDSKTLVTVMAGMWDVINAYNQAKLGAITQEDALNLAQAAGVNLGNLVNTITNRGAGGRVVYVRLPNLGLSPFAAAEEAANAGSAAFLTELSTTFNLGRRVGDRRSSGFDNTVTNNGQWAGVVLADTIVNAMATRTVSPNGYGITSPSGAACTATLPNCTDTVLDATDNTFVDLQTGAISSGVHRYLWAGDYYLGPSAHAQIGAQAVQRATLNPF